MNAMRVTGVAFLLALVACGGPQVSEARHAPKKVVQKAEPVPTDPLPGFSGRRVQPGEEFELSSNPIGVPTFGLILSLTHVDWVTHTSPNGETIREGKADILVQKGEDVRTVRIDEGASRKIHGCRLELQSARVEYDDERMRWLPHATVVIAKE